MRRELDIELRPNLRTMNATDAIFPLAAGYQCAAICSCNQWKNPSNYHWRTDTPENVNYETVADAIRLSEAVIRKLDERWVGGWPAPVLRSGARTREISSPP